MSSCLFQSKWSFLYREIWKPLSKTTSATPDMFIELLRYASVKLRLEPRDETLNDPKLAKEAFKKLSTPPDEKTCLALLEGFYETLSTFNTDINRKYQFKLKEFIERHNLRYTLTSDCEIHLSLTGLLVSQYANFRKSVLANALRNQCLEELEINIGRLSEQTAEENCIRIASNLLEGITVDKTTNGQTTFGRAISGCRNSFPHESLIESARNFYQFFSDYPNLRHAGTYHRKIRDLKKMMLFFQYLSLFCLHPT